MRGLMVVVLCLVLAGCSDWWKQTKMDPPTTSGKKSDWTAGDTKAGPVVLRQETPTDNGTASKTWTFPPGTQVQGKDVELRNKGLGMQTNQPVKNFDPGDPGKVDLKEETSAGVKGAEASQPAPNPVSGLFASFSWQYGVCLLAVIGGIALRLSGTKEGLWIALGGVGGFLMLYAFQNYGIYIVLGFGLLAVGYVVYLLWDKSAKAAVAETVVRAVENVSESAPDLGTKIKSEVLAVAGRAADKVKKTVTRIKTGIGL
jgi:hypothetical protein